MFWYLVMQMYECHAKALPVVCTRTRVMVMIARSDLHLMRRPVYGSKPQCSPSLVEYFYASLFCTLPLCLAREGGGDERMDLGPL